MEKVVIIIPIYKKTLTDLERRLVCHNVKILSKHKIVFLIPRDLDLEILSDQIPIMNHEKIYVSDNWLGCKNGIAGYNEMLLSENFYALFEDFEYILICQIDAYIFRDELLDWCNKNYDYIGAPWPRKPKYDFPVMKIYHKIRQRMHRRRKGFIRQNLLGRVGNGGLSLRNVMNHRIACIRYKEKVNELLKRDHHHHNEDVFWALVPKNFKYPRYSEAMHFSIDTNPAYCLKHIDNKLPFGCHGLTKPEIWKFWENILKI